MTVQLFVSIFVMGSAVATLFTQALKKGWPKMAPNLLAFIVAIVIGGIGTAVFYVLFDVEWDIKNIVSLVMMIFTVWIGAMVGYDKVIQLITQIKTEK